MIAHNPAVAAAAAGLLLLAGCQQAEAPANESGAAAQGEAGGQADTASIERGRQMVRDRFDPGVVLAFRDDNAYRHGNAVVVCGRFDLTDAAGEQVRDQRYVAVLDGEAFLEAEMEDGDMDAAFAEFCRNP